MNKLAAGGLATVAAILGYFVGASSVEHQKLSSPPPEIRLVYGWPARIDKKNGTVEFLRVKRDEPFDPNKYLEAAVTPTPTSRR